MAQDAEAGRNIIQHLGDIFADDGLHPAAARFRAILGRQARYMRRNWARAPTSCSGFGVISRHGSMILVGKKLHNLT